MNKMTRYIIAVLFTLAITGHAFAEEVSFNRDIRPILSDRCYYCHGFDPNHREADLRLDVREDAEYVWDVDSPDDSELIYRITSDDPDSVMPPPDAHKKAISKAEVDLIRRWIEQGAEYEPHWAFTLPERPAIEGSDKAAIDSFVQRKLAKHDLELAEAAPPAQLLRRLSLDLTGLPPTADQMRQFEQAYASQPKQAYEDAVDRLLASPRFGERMSMEWLDVARYADTNGFQLDLSRTNWPWRDWVIKAYNENMPFDQFTIEQLAGDLLDDPTNDQLVATAFNRNHMINGEGGAIEEENLVKYSFDRVETTSTTFLGLTVGCAQCHDHKFDPIKQADYYSLIAMFNQMDEPGGVSKKWRDKGADKKSPEPFGISKPFVAVGSDADKAKLAVLHEKVLAARKNLKDKEDEYGPAFVEWVEEMRTDQELITKRLKGDFIQRVVGTAPLDDLEHEETKRLLKIFLGADPRWKSLNSAARGAGTTEEAFLVNLPHVMIMQDDRPRDTFILNRGNYETPGEKVTPSVPSFLPQLPEDVKADRLSLARWMVSGDNPLTARVVMNRYWQLLFGRALVDTPDDFGMQGALPTHPDLLDWLAVEFVDSGWDVKHMFKTIVMSETYQQTSQIDASRITLDPENKMYVRGPRHRLDSRFIRDSALSISGLMTPTIGGPPVKPYQPPGIWEELSLGKNKFFQSTGEDLYRRSLYTFWRRVVGPTNFFDVPARQNCSVRALRTSTPLHALTLLNDMTYVEAARVWAGKIVSQLADGQLTDDQAAIEEALYTVTARHPVKAEIQLVVDALSDARQRFASDGEKADQLLAIGESTRNEKLDVVDHAAWTTVCLLVLNLDEAISKP